jgi:hypothetical protein
MAYKILKIAGTLVNGIVFSVFLFYFVKDFLESKEMIFSSLWLFSLALPFSVVYSLWGKRDKILPVAVAIFSVILNGILLAYAIFIYLWPMGNNKGMFVLLAFALFNEIVLIYHLKKNVKGYS